MVLGKKLFVTIILFVLCFCFYFCNSENVILPEKSYLNHNDTVAYLGSETCKGCHKEIYETFMKTGMGESFGLANPKRSKSIIHSNTVVYDSLNNFYYKPFWKRDSLFVNEFRLKNGDTIFSRIEHIKYIVGSGHHTNSHIYEENGYLYQAPITFYTQDKIWDFAPGFSNGFNSRFDRVIASECMNCHNSFCEQPKGSENKYDFIEQGIGCERCHGPGEIHVKLKTQNVIVDTSKYIDYSIVNPAKLDRKTQMQVCQRCHVQGISVLKEENTFYDFKPGQNLEDYMEVFLPRYDGAKTKFIMASQADRLMQSACYQNSEMTCISCHNPHVSTRVTAIEVFNNKCKNCHQTKKDKLCSENIDVRNKLNDNCSSCHMPKSTSIDIPHVKVTDHLIRIQPTDREKQKPEKFTHLQHIIGENVDPAIKAIGYLSFYEKFTQNKNLLDSVQYFCAKNTIYLDKQIEAKIWLNFIKQDFKKVVNIANNAQTKIKDAWTLYRIGESYSAMQDYQSALKYLKQSVDYQQVNLDFNIKYANALFSNAEYNKAEKVYQFVLAENKNNITALTNLGFININLGSINEAKMLYEKALSINPDYVPALLNLTGYYLLKQNKNEAIKTLYKILEIDNENSTALGILKKL